MSDIRRLTSFERSLLDRAWGAWGGSTETLGPIERYVVERAQADLIRGDPNPQLIQQLIETGRAEAEHGG